MMTPEHNIESLCHRSHAIAKEKGWLAEDGKDARSFAGATALIHSELSEALEEYRKHRLVDEIYYEVSLGSAGILTVSREELRRAREDSAAATAPAKPAGIPFEIADVIIRIAQRVGSNGSPKLLQDYVNGNHFHMEKHFDFETFIARAHRAVSKAYDECETAKGDETSRHVVDELADAVSMCFAFCKSHAIDLWAAIDEKEAYNRTRSRKHGNKKI